VKVPVASDDSLEPGDLRRVFAKSTPICLARSEDGDWYAVGDLCSHEAYALSDGDVWGDEVECPLHGSRFSLKTGEPDQLPATKPIPTYPLTVVDGQVYVDLPDT
jgi:3-phenylpropionate/trans-cinnamate dioxygenase ferredoxin subunit